MSPSHTLCMVYGFVDLLSSCCLIQLLLHKSSAVRDSWKTVCSCWLAWFESIIVLRDHDSALKLTFFALCFSIETLRFIFSISLESQRLLGKNIVSQRHSSQNIVNIKKFSSIERKSWRFFRASERRENSPQEIIINKWRDTLRRWDWIIFSLYQMIKQFRMFFIDYRLHTASYEQAQNSGGNWENIVTRDGDDGEDGRDWVKSFFSFSSFSWNIRCRSIIYLFIHDERV